MIKNFLCTVDCRVIDMYIHQIGHWNPHINIFLINTWQKYHIFTSDHPTCVCLPPRASAMHLNLHSDHIFSNMRNHSSLVVWAWLVGYQNMGRACQIFFAKTLVILEGGQLFGLQPNKCQNFLACPHFCMVNFGSQPIRSNWLCHHGWWIDRWCR